MLCFFHGGLDRFFLLRRRAFLESLQKRHPVLVIQGAHMPQCHDDVRLRVAFIRSVIRMRQACREIKRAGLPENYGQEVNVRQRTRLGQGAADREGHKVETLEGTFRGKGR